MCTANFGMHKQPQFGSCAAQPEPLDVGSSKWAPAETSAAQIRSAVSMPYLLSTHSHFSFRCESHCGVTQHAKAASFGAQPALAKVYSQLNSVISVPNTVTSAHSSQFRYFPVASKKCYAPRIWMMVTCVYGQACCNFHETVLCYGQMLVIAVMLHINILHIVTLSQTALVIECSLQ